MNSSTTDAQLAPPRVLFVGDDASSPQIAASLLRQATGDRVTVETASTHPGDPTGRADEMLVAMGLNPADDRRLSARSLHTADRVVSLGAGLDVAQLPGPRYEEWDLEQGDLLTRVEALGEDLTAPPVRRRSWLTVVRGWLRVCSLLKIDVRIRPRPRHAEPPAERSDLDVSFQSEGNPNHASLSNQGSSRAYASRNSAYSPR